jgi:hypothetical protein
VRAPPRRAGAVVGEHWPAAPHDNTRIFKRVDTNALLIIDRHVGSDEDRPRLDLDSVTEHMNR